MTDEQLLEAIAAMFSDEEGRGDAVIGMEFVSSEGDTIEFTVHSAMYDRDESEVLVNVDGKNYAIKVEEF